MAKNNKGKAIYIGSEEEEWEKVLTNHYLIDLVLDGFGGEPIDEYGSYRKIPNELRNEILNWMKKQDGYYEVLLDDSKEEEGEEKQETVHTGLPKFDELEHRISHLEVLLKHLKDKKDNKKKK